jgi:large subunit ribosomal protein L13
MQQKTTIRSTDRAAARWYVVDAANETLGRMASKVAQMLMGKHRPEYTPHADTGDFVVVINAADVHVTGKKAERKVYRHHNGNPGGLVEQSYAWMQAHQPEEIVRLAVRRMMPKTTLGRHMLKKLKVYPGKEHPHHAQKPEPLSLGTRASQG